MADSYVDPVFGEVPMPAAAVLDAQTPTQPTVHEDPVFGTVEALPPGQEVPKEATALAVANQEAKKGASWTDTLSGFLKAAPDTIKSGIGGILRSAGEQAQHEPNPMFSTPEMFSSEAGKRYAEKTQAGLKKNAEAQAEFGKKMAEEAQKRIDAATPKDMNFAQRAVFNAGISVGQVAPGAIASILTRTPTPMLASMGLLEYGNSYQQARDAGLNEDASVKYAALNGAIEVGTELIPAKELFKAGSGPMKRLVRFMAAELPGEEIATITQTLNAQVHNLQDDMTAQEWMMSLADTAAATVLAGGVQSGVASGIHKIGQRRKENAITEGNVPRDNRPEHSGAGGVGQAPAQTSDSNRPVGSAEVGSTYPTATGQEETQVSQEAVTPSTAGATINDPVFGEVPAAPAETAVGIPKAIEYAVTTKDQGTAKFSVVRHDDGSATVIPQEKDSAYEPKTYAAETATGKNDQELLQQTVKSSEFVSAEMTTPPATETTGRREQNVPVTEERRTGERRIDNEVRSEVQNFINTAEQLGMTEEERRSIIEKSGLSKLSKNMTLEEVRNTLRTSRKTGLPNDIAYIEDITERKNKPLTGALDVDSLKWVNDNMGHDAGDQLLSLAGRAIKEELQGSNIKGYHLSGDEFVLQGDSKLAIDQAVKNINDALQHAEITVETPSGEIITKKGFQITHGVSPSPKRADFELAAEKIRKEKAGLRAARGEEPPGVVRKPAARKQDQEHKAPVQKIKKPVNGLPGTAKPVTNPQPGKVDLSKKFEFSKESTNARIREAQKGAADTRGIIQRIRDGLDYLKRGFSRHYINIPHTPEWANQIEYLRQLENAPEAAKENTVHYIRSVVGDMSKSEFGDFQVKVLLDDLMYEAKAGRDLPFGYTEAELAVDHANITARIDAQPKLKKAVEFRNQYIQDLGTKLVEKGILTEDHLHNPNYFRHQVLEYARIRNMAQGSATKLRKPRPGYAKERAGSIKDINANYLESEFEYVHRALIDMKTAETIKKIKTSDDITAQVKQDARAENGKALLATGKLTPEQETEYNRLVATGKKTALDNFLKEHLGDKYKSWEKFIPETHRVWQEEKGNIFFMGKTVGEHSVDALIDLAAKNQANLGVHPDDIADVLDTIKQSLIVGGRKPQMIIRTELADTLDNLRTSTTRGLFDTALSKPMGYWKIWTLINPHHAFKYNINNMFSDMDAIIAGNPGVFKQLFPAMKEIYAIANGKKPSQAYEDALERNVFSSGFVVQEVSDINRLSEFSHFKDPNILSVPKKAALKYWRFARGATQFRENAFRYAAYLDYISKFDAGKSLEDIGYGATNPEMVKALTSKKDKAALLARDLIGDYGGISAFGQEIRKKFIPFYSWMEINFKRYLHLIDNAFKQGSTKGVKTLAVVGAGRTAWLGVRIWLLYGLINLWNHMFFGDEEDKLSVDDKQRLHLIIGTNSKGEVVSLPIAGAWADFLSNFGFEEALGIVRAADKGADKISEILKAISKAPVNKVIGGATPVIKVPVELFSGQSYWPDVFSPRVIPDRERYVARTLSFENEFDWLTGRPSKGYLASLGDAFVTSRDPEEAAYNSIRKKAFEFKQNVLGYEGISSISTPKSEIIKLYKQALKLGDKDAAKRLRREMYGMKITPSDMQKALKRAHPLASIPVKNRSEFLRSLSSKERESLQEAIRYYNQTYR